MHGDPETLRSITPRDLKRRLDAGERVLVLDVREPDEYRDWHIQGSVNLPLGAVKAGGGFTVPEGARVVTVCAHGARSAEARDALAERGVQAVSLDGGMVAWNGVYDAVPVPSALAEDAEVLQVRRVGKGCISYVIVSGGEAAVIDPTIDVTEFVELAKSRGAAVTTVLETHAHADHASGARALARATGASLVAPDETGPFPGRAAPPLRGVVPVGRVALRVVPTPGHTPGSVCYQLADLLFTGDTLFVEGVGRPDLGQDVAANAAVLWDSLHHEVLAEPEGTLVLPGHFGTSVVVAPDRPIVATVGDLRARLPPLSLSRGEFVKWVAARSGAKPANFEAIKRHNQGLAPVEDEEDLREMEAGPNRCAVAP